MIIKACVICKFCNKREHLLCGPYDKKPQQQLPLWDFSNYQIKQFGIDTCDITVVCPDCLNKAKENKRKEAKQKENEYFESLEFI